MRCYDVFTTVYDTLGRPTSVTDATSRAVTDVQGANGDLISEK